VAVTAPEVWAMPGERSGYPATPLLARLTPANGWHHDLVGDDHPYALVVVRVGPLWTDSGAIGGGPDPRDAAPDERQPADPAALGVAGGVAPPRPL